MAAMTETQVAAVELEKVRKDLPKLFERDTVFYASIEKKDVEIVSPREMRVPMEMWPGGKSGHFDPAGGSLGLGSGPTFDKAVVTPVTTKHGIQWELKADWATDDSRKAVVKTVRKQTADAMTEYRRFLDCMAMTAGTGILATVSSVSANHGGTNTIDRYTCGTEFGVRLLRYNQDVVFCTTAYAARTAADGSAYSATNNDPITNIDYVNRTFDLAYDAQHDAAATDYVLPSGLALGSAPTSFYGVAYHHDSASTGTWLGLNRATYPQIRANSVNAAGSLALSHARLAMNKIGDRLGVNEKPKVVAWMHPCQKQAYEEMGQLVQVVNRNSGSAQDLDLYFNVMQIAGAPIRESYSWSKSRIDFVAPQYWGRAEMAPVDWFQVEGRKIFELRDGTTGAVKASFLSYITSSFQYFVTNPAACSYIYGLTIPSGY